MNITMTFWSWLAQCVTNIFYLVVLYLFYGKTRFYHSLLAVLTVFFNFNILPLFYLFMADENFKYAMLNKQYLVVLKLLFKC
jgi:hypothetical protein